MSKVLPLCAVIFLMIGSACQAGETPTILTFGDSITQRTDSYRSVLVPALARKKLAVKFIGPKKDSVSNHAGYGGKSTGHLLRISKEVYSNHPADIVMIHSGHNSFSRNKPVQGIIRDTHAIIDTMRGVNPDVVILLAQVIPAGKLPKYSYIPELNRELASLSRRLVKQGYNIVLVDLAGGFDWKTDTAKDKVHPNESGAKKMADRWMEALRPLLDKKDAGVGKTLNKAIMQRTNEILKNLKDTKYSHRTVVDEKLGKYHLDCSGLVFHVLRGAAPRNLANVPTKNLRPLAFEFHDWFAGCPPPSPGGKSRGGWLGIPRMLDARPGDFLVWRKEEIVKGKTTGHIMIIAEKPVADPDGRIQVRVVDSTTGPHANDTRKPGASGVGIGTLWCVVDDKGGPAAYYSNEKVTKPKVRRIAIGRATAIRTAGAQPGKAYLSISMKADRLGSNECTLDRDHPFVRNGLKEGAAIMVTRHDGAKKAAFRLRLRRESPGSWLCIRMSKAGRKRLGYAAPKKEELKLTLLK